MFENEFFLFITNADCEHSYQKKTMLDSFDRLQYIVYSNDQLLITILNFKTKLFHIIVLKYCLHLCEIIRKIIFYH